MSTASDEAAVAELKVSADGEDWREISSPLQSVDIEDHDHLTDKATILLDDHTGVLAHASFEGLEVRVTMGWNEQKSMIFEGVVTGSRMVTQRDGQRVELTALDFTYRMGRHTPEPPMQWRDGQRLSEVITSIVSRPEYDITPFQIEPPEDIRFTEDRPLRQANVSDWDFLQLLAERHLCRAFIEFDGQDTSKFYFVPIQRLATADPIGILNCCRGMGDLISFDYERISSGALVERSASATDPASGEPVTQPAPPTPPRPPLPPPATERDRDLSASQREAVEALVELAAAADARITPAPQRVAGEASDPDADAARVVPDPTRRLGLLGRGVATGNVLLRAKSRVTISGVAPWAEGDWYLTRVNHVYTRQRVNNADRASYVTRFRATR